MLITYRHRLSPPGQTHITPLSAARRWGSKDVTRADGSPLSHLERKELAGGDLSESDNVTFWDVEGRGTPYGI